MIHSVKFNDAISNGMVGKRVLIVGIGNSAVDAATNCASVGRYILTCRANINMHAVKLLKIWTLKIIAFPYLFIYKMGFSSLE